MQRLRQEQQSYDGRELVYWIWLGRIPGIGIASRRMLLKKFHTPKNIFYADFEELLAVPGIGIKKAEQIYHFKNLDIADSIIYRCQQNNIHIMTLNDTAYPDFAKNVPSMPTHLYYKGILNTNTIGTAIVGARRCSRQGKKYAVEMAIQLAKQSVPLISGMAKGIDSYALTACIKSGGYPVAVLGNGLDICYPSEHKLLMQRIEENGLLLSEYEPGIRPSKLTFPQRNRIIAAWSTKIIVIDAGKGSGALITADYAKKYKRTVFENNFVT